MEEMGSWLIAIHPLGLNFRLRSVYIIDSDSVSTTSSVYSTAQSKLEAQTLCINALTDGVKLQRGTGVR